MNIISAHTSINNKIPLNSNLDILHDLIVEFNNQIYHVEIKAKDTIHAAEKILKMTDEEFISFLRTQYHED